MRPVIKSDKTAQLEYVLCRNINSTQTENQKRKQEDKVSEINEVLN